MNPLELIKKVTAKEIDIVSNAKNTLDECRKINDEYSYFLNFSEDIEKQAKSARKGRLYGLPVSVKDCICVKDLESRAGSKILENYHPVFDATVIEKIRKEGALILGKTSQDVFGFGSFNVNVGLGENIPRNPYDKERATGGSSGGSAGITNKISMPHVSISESTGGSIAAPASYCGVYGITPTYGRVSRYGLMDYASSMDKIGLMSKDIESLALILEIISGSDEKDSTSSDMPVLKFTKTKQKKFKVCLIKESLGKGVMKEVAENLKKYISGIDYDLVSMDLTFKYAVQTYYLISMSEASTNLAKYCGLRYGKQEELKGDYNEYFSDIRSRYFEKEAKRRIILGTFARMSGFRDAFYIKALKVRTKIIDEYKELFRKYDLIISPTMPNIAPKFSEISKLTPLENYMMDIMTVGPNLGGFPHLSIPSGFFMGMPTGLMAISDHFEEQKLIDFARCLK